MKKIAFFGIKTFPSRGGTDRVAENIIAQLRHTYAITVYCFQDPDAMNYLSGVKVVQFKRLAGGGLGSFIYFFFSAVHLLIWNKVDLVHIHKTESAFFAPLLRLRYKIVSTSHEIQYRSDKWSSFAKVFFRFTEWIYINYSTVCTCISKPLTEYYNKNHNTIVKYIPNGINLVDPASFNIKAAKSFLPPEADIEKPFLLFSARRLMEIKGCHTMLKALHKINYKGQVIITGELHGSLEYGKLLHELSVGLNVFFVGLIHPLAALQALIQYSDLYIFPSETEGMSIMLLEVASVGRPIVASDIPENKEIFSESEVIYFKSKDADDLAEKIKYALSDIVRAKQFGINCQKKVFSDYLWSNIAFSYAQVYDELLK